MPAKKLLSAVAFIAVVAVFATFSPTALQADSFNWTDIGAGITSASGTITATSIGGGDYIVDSGSGSFNGVSMTLVPGIDNGAIQLSPSGLFLYNNMLYLSGNPTLDVDGLLFADGSGNELNIWGNGTPGSYSTYTEINGSYMLQNTNSDFSIVPSVPTPEPSTLLLMCAGLAILMGLAWRRKSQAASSEALQ